MDEDRDIGVALSGGGHRATIFSFGALLALVDTGLHRRVVSVSSVSGGSIANAVVANGPDFATAPDDDIRSHIGTAIAAVRDRGILLGGAKPTRVYLWSLIAGLVTLIAGLAVTALAVVDEEDELFAIGVLLAVVGLVAAWNRFAKRSKVTEEAIDGELLGGEHVTLRQIAERDRRVHHVLCTTELQTGTTFYLTNRLVYGDRFGVSLTPGALTLAEATQASAAVPGLFRARTMPLASLGLDPIPGKVPGRKKFILFGPRGPERTVAIERVVVDDGGTYDNMADSWEFGFVNRTSPKRYPQVLTAQPKAAGTLLVVNASPGWDSVRPIVSRGVKFELDQLLRAQGVQYDASTARRREMLRVAFNGNIPDRPKRGTFVQIVDNPFKRIQQFAGNPRAGTAGEALTALGRTEKQWDAVVTQSRGVGTKLAPLGASDTWALLEHAYVTTRIHLYVTLGEGSPPEPGDITRLRQIFDGTTQAGAAGVNGAAEGTQP